RGFRRGAWADRPLGNVNAVTLRRRLIPAEVQARVTAASRTLVMGTLSVGSLAGGALGGVIGVTPTIVVCALVGAAPGSSSSRRCSARSEPSGSLEVGGDDRRALEAHERAGRDADPDAAETRSEQYCTVGRAREPQPEDRLRCVFGDACPREILPEPRAARAEAEHALPKRAVREVTARDHVPRVEARRTLEPSRRRHGRKP